MADEGFIPVGSGDFPIDSDPLDESGVYTVSLVKAALSPKTDKNGYMYCSVQCEVTEGDFEGVTLMRNYLPLPVVAREGARKAEVLNARRKSIDFERFCQSFKIKSGMPAVNLNDQESKSAWQEWIEKFYGHTGKVTVQNQEFNGRMRSGINDFIL